MITWKVDISQLKAKLARIGHATPQARREATKVLAGAVARDMITTPHRDTNRYVNGIAEAANDAGVGPLPIRPLNKAAGYYTIQKKLLRQYQKWLNIVTRYQTTQPKRNDKWVRQAKRNLERAAIALDRFERTTGGAVIAFDMRTAAHRGKLVSIREPRVYGGTGRIYDVGDATLVELHNLEAHASIVESRFRVFKRSVAFLKAWGVRAAGKAFIAKLRSTAGIEAGPAAS